MPSLRLSEQKLQHDRSREFRHFRLLRATLRGARITVAHESPDALGLDLFGGPDVTGGQAVCFYDGTGFLAAATAPAGGTCLGNPCWRRQASGFAYTDKGLTPDGLSKMTLKAGAPGKGKIGVKGSGAGLLMPALPLSSPVRVQLRSGDGACFESVFSTPLINVDERFKARGD